MNRYLSSSLLLTVLALLGIGVVQVYSSSYVFAIETYNDGLFFFKRQLMFAAVALVVMVAAIQVPFDWIRRYAWLLWVASAIGILLTLVPGLGVRVGGAHRWLQMPFGFRVEPAEFMKLGFVCLMATLISRYKSFQIKRILVWSLAVILPLLLLLKQPDFGTFVLLVAVGFGLLFAFGLPWSVIVVSSAVAVPTFYALVMNVGYRRARVLAFLDPWSEAHQKGFQAIQSMLSFHAGGIWGTGLGQGQGKLFFLPEAHTDFTLAVLGEEMGFVGLLVVMSLFSYLVFRCFQLSLKTEDRFKKAMALGIALVFGLTVVINAGMAMGLLPTKGMALPFLSYGGSSLVASALMFGLMLNLENEILNGNPNRHRMAKILRETLP
ncbi:MAG: putative lipid II flippase FtsW [Bdellovibrionales bacterium]